MGKTTTISWTDHTWNPWLGCQKVSEGCTHCYMFRNQETYGQDPLHIRRSKTTFNDPLKWKDPARVFTCSMSDFFIEKSDAWRADAWDIIRKTPHLNYQILTKRPDRIEQCLPDDWGDGWPNVWLGVSVENQRRAKERIKVLLNIPAKIRFLSCEPLLGPINLGAAYPCGYYCDEAVDHGFLTPGRSVGIQWVIVGGESGPGYRPMNMAWARSLRDQCVAFNVPFFFKQDSSEDSNQRPYIVEEDKIHTIWAQFPDGEDKVLNKQLSLW